MFNKEHFTCVSCGSGLLAGSKKLGDHQGTDELPN